MQSVKSSTMKNLDKMAVMAEEREKAQAVVDSLTKKIEKEIVAARVDNWPWPAIMGAARLSRQGAMEAAKRSNNGTAPVPRQQR